MRDLDIIVGQVTVAAAASSGTLTWTTIAGTNAASVVVPSDGREYAIIQVNALQSGNAAPGRLACTIFVNGKPLLVCANGDMPTERTFPAGATITGTVATTDGTALAVDAADFSVQLLIRARLKGR